MWTVGLRPESTPARHDGKALIGAIGNGANIFPTLYYKRAGVDKLAILAAHTILTGHKCDPSLVEGLEIYVSKDGIIRSLNADELSKLRQTSRELVGHIGSLFQ